MDGTISQFAFHRGSGHARSPGGKAVLRFKGYGPLSWGCEQQSVERLQEGLLKGN